MTRAVWHSRVCDVDRCDIQGNYRHYVDAEFMSQ